MNIIRLKPTRPKSLSKTQRNKKENRETIQVNQPFSPKSKQLDLLDVVETNRPPSRYSSQPNLSIFSQGQCLITNSVEKSSEALIIYEFCFSAVIERLISTA